MTADESFESAEYLASWAATELEDLKALVIAFRDSEPATMVKEFNEKTRQIEIKVRTKAIPLRARGLTNNIVKNLRDALDQVAHGASFHITGVAKRNTHFPFGTSPEDLEEAMRKGPCKDIPDELYPIIRSFEPYPTGEGYSGGNNYLRLLSTISGPHKHRVTLGLGSDPTKVSMGAGDGGAFIKAGKGGVVLFPFLSNRKPGDEIVLMTLGEGSETDVKFQASLYIAFTNPKLRDIPVIDFLIQCSDTVAKIIQDFRAQATALPSRRTV